MSMNFFAKIWTRRNRIQRFLAILSMPMPAEQTQQIEGRDSAPQSWEFVYRHASERWQNITWPQSAFVTHAKLVAPDGSPNATDLFVSGSAGFRIEEAWSVLDKQFSPRVIRFLRKFKVPGHDPEDIWGSTILRLSRDAEEFPAEDFHQYGFERIPAAIVRFDGRTSLENYVLLIAKRIALDEIDRRRVTSTSLTPELSVQIPSKQRTPDALLQDSDVRNALLTTLSGALAALENDDRLLFSLVYLRGMDRRKAALFIGWPDPSKATRHLQRVGKCLSSAIEDHLDPSLSKLNPDDVNALLTFFRISMQGAPDVASTSESHHQDGPEKAPDAPRS